MLRLCLIVLIMLLPFKASAEEIGLSQETLLDDEIPIGPVAICTVQNNAGLYWEDGKYRSVNYKKSIYIIRKMDHRVLSNEDYPNNVSCFYDLGDKRRKNASFKKDFSYMNINLVQLRNLNRCFTIQAQGDPIAEKILFADSCKEEMNIEKNEVTIRCKNGGMGYDFQPTGEMLRYSTPTVDFSVTEYRDSVYVENAQCTKLY